jgi:hypothetical protein
VSKRRLINSLISRFYGPWHDIEDLPQTYDVIWALLPRRKGPAQKEHPALVLGSKAVPRLREAELYVLHGTSDLNLPDSEEVDLILNTDADRKAAGISRPTRFCTDQIIQLPWDRIVVPNKRVVGRLNTKSIERLEALIPIDRLPEPCRGVRGTPP